MIPIPLFAFKIFELIWPWKFNFSSTYQPRCFWHAVRATGAILKAIDGWHTLTVFLKNITSCACFESSGLKFIFHLYAKWEVIFRSLSSWVAEILGSYTVENNDVSSANSFTVDWKFSGRLFMYIRKSNGPKRETCGTPASTDDQLEHWPFSTTRCNLLLQKLLSRLRRFP